MARKALVVGIGNYKDKIPGCLNDATEMEKVLSFNENGDKNFETKLVYDIPTQNELRKLISDCFRGDEEVALFFFSGHGALDSRGGFIITPDNQGVSMNDILLTVNNSNCKNKVVILNCCHSGTMGDVSFGSQVMTTIKDGVTILTASKPNEYAYIDKNKHGVFTELLLESLRGGAADVMGDITAGGIYAYIDRALGRWGDQRPMFKTNISQFFSLRTVIPQVDKETIRNTLRYFNTQGEEFSLDPSFEDTNTKENIGKQQTKEPYAIELNTKIFKNLQSLVKVGLIIPVGEIHMYDAAMNSKSCKLTTIGQHYWRLVKENKI